MTDKILIDITPEKLKLAYAEFQKGLRRYEDNGSKIVQEGSEKESFVHLSLGIHCEKHIVLQWLPEFSEDGEILNP